MGSVFSGIRSFVRAQLDKAQERRLMEYYPAMRDLPDEERKAQLQWLMESMKPGDETVVDDEEYEVIRCNFRFPLVKVEEHATPSAA